MYRVPIARDDQWYGNASTHKEKPVLRHMEQNGGASADQRPNNGDDEQPAWHWTDRRQKQSEREDGRGTWCDAKHGHFGIIMTDGHPDQRIDNCCIGDERGADPGGQVRLQAEAELMTIHTGVEKEAALDNEQPSK